jgi:hypothetical protein
VPVAAGRLSAEFFQGGLRSVRFNETEVIRRVFVAVRDGEWGTVPGSVSDLTVQADADRFMLSFVVANLEGGVQFRWRGVVEGNNDGTVRFEMKGRCLSSFAYRRIGICVLHPPAEFAGRPYSAAEGGAQREGLLPALVAPPQEGEDLFVPMIAGYERLRLFGEHAQVDFRFAGDLFEMEDQRNWSDDSFKTYSRFPAPSSDPEQAPVAMPVQQSVVARIRSAAQAAGGRRVRRRRISVGDPSGRSMPPLGVSLAEGPRDATTFRRLAKLAPAHLRVELFLRSGDWGSRLRAGVEVAARYGCPLELALFLGPRCHEAVMRLAAELKTLELARVLVYSEGRAVTERSHLAQVGSAMAAGVAVGVGTDLHFAELNQFRPRGLGVQLVGFPIMPQVHASDEQTIMETPDAVRTMLETARGFCGESEIAVSPLTLGPRPEAAARAAGDPGPHRAADPRQVSLFAAAWTLAEVQALAEAGATSATLCADLGPTGVMVGPHGLPDGWPQLGCDWVFPIYHVLRDLNEARARPLLSCLGDHQSEIAAMAYLSPAGLSVLLANRTPAIQSVSLTLPPPFSGSGRFRVRRLHVGTALGAMHRPEAFRSLTQRDEFRARGPVLRLSGYECDVLEFPGEVSSQRSGGHRVSNKDARGGIPPRSES